MQILLSTARKKYVRESIWSFNDKLRGGEGHFRVWQLESSLAQAWVAKITLISNLGFLKPTSFHVPCFLLHSLSIQCTNSSGNQPRINNTHSQRPTAMLNTGWHHHYVIHPTCSYVCTRIASTANASKHRSGLPIQLQNFPHTEMWVWRRINYHTQIWGRFSYLNQCFSNRNSRHKW
jgi:hypothetical protein